MVERNSDRNLKIVNNKKEYVVGWKLLISFLFRRIVDIFANFLAYRSTVFIVSFFIFSYCFVLFLVVFLYVYFKFSYLIVFLYIHIIFLFRRYFFFIKGLQFFFLFFYVFINIVLVFFDFFVVRFGVYDFFLSFFHDRNITMFDFFFGSNFVSMMDGRMASYFRFEFLLSISSYFFFFITLFCFLLFCLFLFLSFFFTVPFFCWFCFGFLCDMSDLFLNLFEFLKFIVLFFFQYGITYLDAHLYLSLDELKWYIVSILVPIWSFLSIVYFFYFFYSDYKWYVYQESLLSFKDQNLLFFASTSDCDNFFFTFCVRPVRRVAFSYFYPDYNIFYDHKYLAEVMLQQQLNYDKIYGYWGFKSFRR